MSLLRRRLSALVLAAAPAGMPAMAEPVHGIAMHGAPALPAGFSHFTYANPHAPLGGELRLGVVLERAPEWHVYWRTPGDSGLSTQIELTLPGGWSAGEPKPGSTFLKKPISTDTIFPSRPSRMNSRAF